MRIIVGLLLVSLSKGDWIMVIIWTVAIFLSFGSISFGDEGGKPFAFTFKTHSKNPPGVDDGTSFEYKMQNVQNGYLNLRSNFKQIVVAGKNEDVIGKNELFFTSGDLDRMEIYDFKPPISGFSRKPLILSMSRYKSYEQESCNVVYVIGKLDNLKFEETINAQQTGSTKLSNKDFSGYFANTQKFESEFTLNSGHYSTKSARELKRGYYLKSLRVSCKKGQLFGLSLGFEEAKEQPAEAVSSTRPAS